MNIILLGAPASGKGTQSSKICSEFSLAHISTGDLLRDNIAKKTKLGLLSEEYITKGQLVPDELVISLIKDKIGENPDGYVFDGFPRTLAQAKELDSIANVDAVIYLEIDEKLLIKRVLSRRVCDNCNKVFSTETYKDSVCDVCHNKLVKRTDDTEKTLQERLNNFCKSTQNMLKYYENKNVLFKVDAQSEQKTFEDIKKILEAKID